MAVIKNHHKNLLGKVFIITTTLGFTFPLTAAILPEDRIDALVHSYHGGGMEINGPSLLIRKMLGTNTSVSANYYVDSISSASIDVITSASPYKEERKEHSVGVNYLHDKSIMSFNYSNSEENDYRAKTYSVGISQDFFGDLTTLSMGYSRGKDDVMRIEKKANGTKSLDANFGTQYTDRHNFRLGLSQILSKHMLLGLNYELITDKGFLNNPYRQVRFADGSPNEFEKYPNTRSSNAISMQLKYYLPYRAAITTGLGLFNDTWGINANHLSLGYSHPITNQWLIDLRYRYYDQSRANFYSDLFSESGVQTYMARDKELSTFNNHTLGFSISYDLARHNWHFTDKGSINFAFDHIMFDYQDFRNAAVEGVDIGTEPLYNFSSNVIQIYLSIWY